MQCQRYEDRIVELHSVIAELTRKLDDQRDDVIKEESELEEEEDEDTEERQNDASFISDSCVDEDHNYPEDDEDDDYASVPFESHQQQPRQQQRRSVTETFPLNMRDFESEIFSLQQELVASQVEAERAKEALRASQNELAKQQSKTERVEIERDGFRRQVEDIKATVEYQEARMDEKRVSSPPASNTSSMQSRSSSERRSLRRRRHAGGASSVASSEVSKVRKHFCLNGRPFMSSEMSVHVPAELTEVNKNQISPLVKGQITFLLPFIRSWFLFCSVRRRVKIKLTNSSSSWSGLKVDANILIAKRRPLHIFG